MFVYKITATSLADFHQMIKLFGADTDEMSVTSMNNEHEEEDDDNDDDTDDDDDENET